MTYLCYDLKGIQSFIFAVPRLRYVCGGSALIDRFDRETVPNLKPPGTRLLFAGGGKGAFACADEAAAANLRRALVRAAHRDGLGISFGTNADYSEAAHVTDESYPWLPHPSELDGQPCSESGLYPTKERIHRLVKRREWQRGEQVGRRFEAELLDGLEDVFDGRQVEFFHDVGDDSDEGRRGAKVLGARNRWAVIAMDGNDMGTQHRVANECWSREPAKLATWLERMSGALDECTRGACRDAIRAVGEAWKPDADIPWEEPVIVPVRPLLVGGDDILVLCHVEHAMRFVQTACDRFAERSRDAAEATRQDDVELWPGTGGLLSITAGVLFAPVSLPLAAALPYAELLLASAKSRGRRPPVEAGPSPACIDWESVTEGLLDTPADRRNRELRFRDAETETVVELTRRPYTLQELVELESLVGRYGELPTTIRHQILPSLRAAFSDRQVFLARLGKHHEALVNDLQEGEDPRSRPRGRWKSGSSGERTTDVVDALLLLEEAQRMTWQTAQIGAGR